MKEEITIGCYVRLAPLQLRHQLEKLDDNNWLGEGGRIPRKTVYKVTKLGRGDRMIVGLDGIDCVLSFNRFVLDKSLGMEEEIK